MPGPCRRGPNASPATTVYVDHRGLIYLIDRKPRACQSSSACKETTKAAPPNILRELIIKKKRNDDSGRYPPSFGRNRSRYRPLNRRKKHATAWQ